MTAKPRASNRWREAIGQRDAHRCAADVHDPRCDRRFAEAHHIVYRSHLVEPAIWLVDNGIALSDYCHALAHRTHNGNISESRKRAAVDAVNAALADKIAARTFVRIRYFESKGISTV